MKLKALRMIAISDVRHRSAQKKLFLEFSDKKLVLFTAAEATFNGQVR
jgi:hypothetical protein